MEKVVHCLQVRQLDRNDVTIMAGAIRLGRRIFVIAANANKSTRSARLCRRSTRRWRIGVQHRVLLTRSNLRPHDSLNAVVTGNRAARTAGNRPPTKPMASAHFIPVHSSCGETLNWKVSWPTPPPSVEAV